MLFLFGFYKTALPQPLEYVGVLLSLVWSLSEERLTIYCHYYYFYLISNLLNPCDSLWAKHFQQTCRGDYVMLMYSKCFELSRKKAKKLRLLHVSAADLQNLELLKVTNGHLLRMYIKTPCFKENWSSELSGKPLLKVVTHSHYSLFISNKVYTRLINHWRRGETRTETYQN